MNFSAFTISPNTHAIDEINGKIEYTQPYYEKILSTTVSAPGLSNVTFSVDISELLNKYEVIVPIHARTTGTYYASFTFGQTYIDSNKAIALFRNNSDASRQSACVFVFICWGKKLY